MRDVHARLQRVFAAAVLTVCIGAPALEMFDRWDHTLQDGNDTEANLVIVALCVGAGFVAAAAMIQRVQAPSASVFRHVPIQTARTVFDVPLILPTPHASPPTILRV